MSIFHISDIADKPSSYTRDIVNKEVIHTYKHIDKLLIFEK